MKAKNSKWMKRPRLPMICAAVFCFVSRAQLVRASGGTTGLPQAAATSKSVGTIKSISGNSIVLTPEGGTDTNVVVQDGARLLQIEPGETDLKKATPLQLSDLQTGDRILVRGAVGPDGKSILILSYDKDVTGHPANKDVTLRLMPAGGGEIRELAKLFGGQGTINVPSWSPDSREIAFVSYQLVYP